MKKDSDAAQQCLHSDALTTNDNLKCECNINIFVRLLVYKLLFFTKYSVFSYKKRKKISDNNKHLISTATTKTKTTTTTNIEATNKVGVVYKSEAVVPELCFIRTSRTIQNIDQIL